MPVPFFARRIGHFARVAQLFVALVALAGCDRQSDGPEQAVRDSPANASTAGDSRSAKPPLSGTLDISKRGSDQPDITFTAPDGKPVKLADFRGKPLLVNLWATWCAPCVVELPTLDALAQREGDRLQVLVVSQDLEGAKIVEPFFAKRNFVALKPYTDTENGLGFAYETGVMPTTILYDAQGKEVWRMLGGMDWNASRAATLMEDTLDSAKAG